MSESELLYTPEPLEIGMLDYIENKLIGYGYESIDRVVEYLFFCLAYLISRK